ncbi:MAG: hypothetical protein GX783_09395 [Clostridiales bacterium]|nr:hypothetical protein [Clostridiales bacterium]
MDLAFIEQLYPTEPAPTEYINIVEDGEANAVVVIPEAEASTNTPQEAFLGFFVNPIAVKFARYQKSNAPEVQWEVNANIASDRWNIILAIPFEEISVDPYVTKTLQGYFFRNYHGDTKNIYELGRRGFLA